MLTPDVARTAIVESLARIAPDAEPDRADPDEDLFDAFDIDSMDFLALVGALSTRFSMPMPESDYPRMRTLSDLTAYLVETSSAARPVPDR